MLGLVTGAVYYGIILHWVALFGNLPWVLLSLYEAAFFAVFAALFVRLKPERTGWLGFIAVPAAWVVLQYVRTLGPYGFPWGSLAHTQANNLPIAQMASITGPWGIDFLLCLASLTVASAITGRKHRLAPMIVAGALTMGMCVFGFACLRSVPNTGGGERVAIIQANMKNDFNPIPNYVDVAYRTYAAMTTDSAKGNPALILWPETALPTDLTTPGWDLLLGPLARHTSADLLVGGYDPASPTGSYNALHLYSAQGKKTGVYHKVQLVPFGEFVPLRDRLPFLRDYGIRPEDVVAAQDHRLLRTRIGKVGVSICFESTFPQIAADETRRGAEVLCVVTNDAWFGHTQAARQHLMMAKLRAIENRRFVLRAAGTGISTVIDPFGRTRDEIGLFREGIIADKVCPRQDMTLYARLGQRFAYLCALITAVGLLAPGRAPATASDAERCRETSPS